MRALLGFVMLAMIGCREAPSGAAAQTAPRATVPSAAASSGTVAVADADRACTTDADCTAILTACSMCAGACTGVRIDRAAAYAGRLDCTGYTGQVCNYDCRPSFGIEQPRCVAGRCDSVRAP